MKTTAAGKPKIGHYFEYAALHCVNAVVNIIPRKLALVLGSIVGRVLYRLGIYQKTVRANFDHVGIWENDEIRKIIPKLYRNIGRYAMDFLRGGRRLPVYRLHDYNIYTEARAKTNGTIIILAHFGNWELLAAIFGRQVDDLNVIAKPMKNPLVEKWLLKKRTALSVETIYTNNALRGMLAALKRNGITAILIDQYLGRQMGTPAPFLGKIASTVRTAAGLVRKTGAAAVPVYAIMNGDGSYDIHFFEADPPVVMHSDVNDSAQIDEDATVSAIQAQHNDIISSWITKHPDHWFGWFHKRFKEYLDYKS
ncbi:MAG: lysophospholipid acyltransferase family protein [Chitinispirillales bacterium]|jgi:KDO2-lipid IV(A) lauroyltransferase|nr:lysophospholipid acyltransferase family protein [Chitinispirillales bacterium]